MRVVWQRTDEGNLERKLPIVAEQQARALYADLSEEKFAAARELFESAKGAFDARPRRDRDAGTNAFDGLEAVAKIVFNGPSKTFGSVLDRHKDKFTKEVVTLLKKLECVRHNHLGHGMTKPYELSAEETDFIYVSCVMGSKIFLRLH